MRKIYAVLVALTLVAFSGASFAVPFASLINTSSHTTAEGAGLDITYVLNDSADSVTIEILDSGSSVVATFAGTTAQGDNAVSWDGTVDNAGGAAVAVGDDYQVRITADKNVASWTQYLARQSGTDGNGQVFEGFSPNGVAVPSDTSSDVFGTVLVSNAWAGRNGMVQMRTDLLTLDGQDGLTDFIDSGVPDAANWAVWAADVMPNGRDCYFTGQQGTDPGGNHFFLDGSTGSFQLIDADPNDDITTFSAGPWFRGHCVVQEATRTFGYGAYGTTFPNIRKWEIVDGISVPGSSVDFLVIDSGSRMSDVESDAAGNIYFTVEEGGVGPRLYRFDAAQVQLISASAPATLDASTQASWTVDFPAPWDEVMGVDITPGGNVYALAYDDAADTAAIFLVGNSSDAAVTKTLADPTDIVADGFSVDGTYARIHSDLFGNLYVYDRGPEQIWAWSPPGNFSSAVEAPTSQSFDIKTVTGFDEWENLK